ncbi:hypothetical protein NCY89_12460, partial [Bacteroides uniformis]
NFVFGNHRFNFICNLLIITYKGTNNKRDYQLFKCFFYPELAYIIGFLTVIAKNLEVGQIRTWIYM